MLRVVQTADVRLGGRHQELGERGAALRERAMAALASTVELAIAERVDLVVVAGNLFDSNTVSRRTVELAARQLGRLSAAGIAAVVIPGSRDSDQLDSLLRVHDLAALSGVPEAAGLLVSLNADRPAVAFPRIGAVVGGLVPPARDGRGGGRGRLFDACAEAITAAASAASIETPYRIGLAAAWPPGHGAPESERVLSEDEIAASNLDIFILGGPPQPLRGSAGPVPWVSSGAPELISLERDDPGIVQLITLDRSAGAVVSAEARRVGTLRPARYTVDVEHLGSQKELIRGFMDIADKGQVLLVRIEGSLRDGLELDPAAIEAALGEHFFAVRVVDLSIPVAPTESPHPAGSVPDILWKDLSEQIRSAESEGDLATAIELRRAFRLVRSLYAAAPAMVAQEAAR